MRNKKIIGIGMIITLVLVAVLVMATVTSVTLQAPSDGAWTNKLYTDLNFSFIFSGNSSATCILKMGFNDVSGNNLTDVYSASVTNNTPTTFTSNTSIPEGQHAWLVSCDAVGSSSRIIGVDRTIPSTITDAPTSWQKNDVTIIFTQNADDGLSSIDYYGCSGITSTPCTIQLLPGFPPISIFVNNEGNNTVRYYAKDAAGNIETTKNIGVLIDKTVPSINLIEPNNSAIFLNQNTFNFKFNVTDALSSTLNCSLKINNVINETDGTVANNTPKTFANKLLPEGTANWLVQCTDLAGNTNTSVTRNMIVNVTPDKAVVFTPTSLVNESSINIYGFVNRAGQNTNVTVYVQQDPDQNKGSQLTTYDAALLGNTTVFNLSVQNTTILYLDDINGEAPPGFAVGNFVDFNHQEPYLLRHQIVAMEYYPWGIQLNITPQLRAPISIGENVYSYNQSQPTGWFNISVSLIEGNNTIKVESRRLGTISPASDSYTVFKDTTPPSINLTNVINYTTTTPTINFTVNDSYAVNVSSIIVNISNATNSTIFNSTQVNCTTLPTCKVQPNLSNGYHNITVTISDVIGNTNTATKEFLIDTQAPQISLVSPADLYIEELSRNKTFSFNVTDDYSSTLNCTVYLNNTNTGNLSNSSAIIVANGGTNQTTFTNLTDATYNWWVTCIDGTGNQNQSEKRTITFNNTPIYAKIEQYSEVISTNSLNLVGVIGKADTMINFTVTQDEKIPQITQSLTNENSEQFNRSINFYVSKEAVANGSNYFFINKTYNNIFNHTDRYVSFSNHDREYLFRYQIKNVTAINNQYYSQVFLEENLSQNITTGEIVKIYNQSKPSGWFNITLTNLHQGENNITILGERMGLTGPSRTITTFYDNQSPSINLTSVINYTTTTPTINFTVHDDYAVNVSSIIVNISNATNSTIFNSTQVNCTTLPTCKVQPNLSNGYHNITVTISDLIGNTNTATKEFLVDVLPPQILLISPADMHVEELSKNSTFIFNATDDNFNTLNCTVYLNNTNTGNLSNSSSILVTGGELNQTIFNNLTDGMYNWWVECIDGIGNQNQSEKRTITFNNTLGYVSLERYLEIIPTNSLNLVGVIGKADTMINFTVTQDEKIPQITQSLTNENSEQFNRSITFYVSKEAVANGSNYFYINKTYNNIFNHTDRYVSFSNHDREYLFRYQIKNVTAINNQYYSQVFLEENLSQNITTGEIVKIYNQSKPSGWFNITLTNLHQGENNITILGERMGLTGPSRTINVFYDNEAPKINISNIPSNLTTNTTTFNFTITDNYNITLPTLLVNITNGTNSTLHVWSGGTSYNTTGWNLGQNITCTGTRYAQACQFTATLNDGTYNMTFQVNDTVNNQNITQKTSIIVASQVTSPTQIIDTGATTDSRSQLNATWTNVTNQTYFSHYELAVGKAIYPNASFNDTKNWFSVGSNTSYQIMNMTLIPGQMYYIHVRTVNIFGATSQVKNTDGIAIEDNSPPEYIPGSSVWVGTDSNNLWTNENSTLRGLWNFTDNETGINKFMFAIGTAKYPQSGWDSVLAQKETTNFGFNESGLTLQQNKSYYFSVKAKNGYQYGFGWSDWYSSEYIKQDLTTPTGGSISYQPGNYTAGSITLTYLTGDDYLSGYNYGQLLMKKTNYSSINGGCNAYSDYETLNVSMVKVDTPTSYFYTSLQDGKCYKFGLKVYDKAGNSVIYTLGNEDYNVTADSTAPSTVMITDDGVITGSRNLLFSWTEAIDPHTGIRNYQYALGTTPGADNIVNFTSNNLTRTLTLNNLPLQDEQIYYLTVKAYNRVGLVSTSYSDGVLYLDMDTPTALTVVKVANDTNASNGYHDFDNDTNTTILLTGENSLTCAWSYYDIDYTQPSQLTNYSWACTNTANNPVNRTGNYTCEIETPNEAVYTVHVNCKDDAGNKQLASENTDITFIKENEPPQINITYPENNIIVNGVISANVSIWDVSNYTARYELREYVNNTLIINQTISNLSNITMNTTGLGGEYIFRVFATDDYNHTSNESVNFVVNNNAPTVRIILSNTYQNSDFNFSIASTLYYNISYNITNITGTLIQNNSWNNTQLIAANTTIISVSASTLPEGVYTIRVVARDNSSNITANKSFIIDKTAPEYRGTLQVEPTEIIYENDTIKLYLNWKETTSLDSIWVVHNANGSSVNYTATNTTPGSQIYENFTRYKVEIPSFMTRTNQTINYTWYARDKAGNQNNTSTNNLYITNRVPNITTTNLSNALLGVSYQENVLFNDSDDSHNNSDFSCAVEGLPITTMIIGTTTCRLTWDSPTPVANNTINVTVTDGINTTKKAFNLTVLQTRVHNITVNTSHTVTSEYWLNNTLMRIITTSGNTNTTLLESANYTLKLKIDNLQMTTSNFNITSNLDVFFQLLNKNTIDNNETGMGLNRTRIPVEAYVFRLNVTPERNGTYEMAFNYTKYPSVTTSKLRIIKLGYDETTGIINYTNATSLTTTLDTSRQLVYATVSNFSAFILVEDTTAPSTPPSGGGRGGGSSRRSGGSFFIPPPTCNDNISNQGEIGVDCGGPCPPCQTCHDTIQNQGEEGVDCGGPCIRCIAPTCNDRIKNGDEEEVDCGGSCRLCTPTPTCTDGILNGGEQGIDCGGSCIPCPGCTNGIRDAGEEGVDCGGVCEQECGPEVIEKPVEVKKTPAYVWFIVLGIIIMGGLVAMWIYKKEERKVKKTAAQVAAEQEEIIDLQDEERSVMARYINKYLAQGFKENDVKNQLLVDGFRQTHIDLVTAAVIRDLKVQEIQDYITDYTKKGYTADELKEWILNQGIEESLLKEAESKLQRAKGDANPSQSELSDIDVDNLLEKKEKRL